MPEVKTIASYKTMYFNLAARVAEAIDILVKAQQEGEEAFLNLKEGPVLFSGAAQPQQEQAAEEGKAPE